MDIFSLVAVLDFGNGISGDIMIYTSSIEISIGLVKNDDISN